MVNLVEYITVTHPVFIIPTILAWAYCTYIGYKILTYNPDDDDKWGGCV